MLKTNNNFKKRIRCSSRNFANRLRCASAHLKNRTRRSLDKSLYSKIAGWGFAVLSIIGLFSYLTFIPEQAFAEYDWETRKLSDITTMQQMNAKICENTESGYTKQLIDSREPSKKYWVAKLADGQCWMTQNLDFDIPSTLDSTTSDVAANASISAIKSSNVSSWGQDNAQIKYYDPGLYVKSNPASTDSCKDSGVTSLAHSSCTAAGWQNVSNKTARTTASSDGNKPVATSSDVVDSNTYDAHYLVGNYYSWNAATAGTGASTSNIDGTQAVSSICPRGWKLPTASNKLSSTLTAGNLDSYNVPGSFAYLFRQYGLATTYNKGNVTTQNVTTGNPLTTNNVYSVYDAPLYYLRAGRTHDAYLVGAGSSSYYWSPVVLSANGAYGFSFGSSTVFFPSFNAARWFGATIRCVADINNYPDPITNTTTSNVSITVSPVISIDVTKHAKDMTVDFTQVATDSIIARVGSNQPYQVLLSTEQSNLEQSPVVENQNIPMVTTAQQISAGNRAWGISKDITVVNSTGITISNPTINANTIYSPIGLGENKALFYTSNTPASEDLTFPVAIAVDSTLPSGKYSTQVTLTAVAM